MLLYKNTPAPVVNMEKLLVVCGPTATGKTKLALKLAKRFNGELISADSRQVYKHLNIGTGKDMPQGAKWHLAKFPISKRKVSSSAYFQFPIGYWETKNKTKIWGYDLISPKKEFSVAQYERIARSIIKDIWRRKKLPILTGGTGLYIKAVIDGIETAGVPKNVKLRESLKERTVKELFEMLSSIDPIKSASLNLSDRRNPRRLIRAIEVAQHNLKGKSNKRQSSLDADLLMVGLTTSKEMLNKNIDLRVQTRVSRGVGNEIGELLKMGINWDMQSMNALGYRQWREHLVGKITKKEVIKKWTKDEMGYAKRQITWFTKDKRIKWFDISKRSYNKDIESEVKKWYSHK